MKKIFLIVFSIFALAVIGQQESNPCINGVSTDPANPTNNALPANGTDNKYYNGLYWYSDLEYPLTDMNVVGGGPYSPMLNVWANSLSYYKYITDAPLPLPENGWELLLANLGRYPDNVTDAPTVKPNGQVSESVNYPYIVLYNKYSGIVRVFLKYDFAGNSNSDAIRVNLEFANDDKLSGLWRLYKGHDQALDQKTDILRIAATVDMTNSPSLWASVDFQVAYDPCTCYKPSQLKISFEQILTSTMELQNYENILIPGEDGTSSPLINNINGLNFIEDFSTNQIDPSLIWLPSFSYSEVFSNTILYKFAETGFTLNKNMWQVLKVYIRKIEQLNDEYIVQEQHSKETKVNIATLKLAEFVLDEIINNNNSNISTATLVSAQNSAIQEAAALNTAEQYNAFGGLGQSNWYEVVKIRKPEILQHSGWTRILNIEQLFDEVKAIISVYGKTLITNNFESDAIATAPTNPMSTYDDMFYTGQSNGTINYDATFFTPGTYGSPGTGSPNLTDIDNTTEALSYPVYNEILGAFAVLETPGVNISKTVPTETIFQNLDYRGEVLKGSLVNGDRGYVNGQRYQSWSDQYQVSIDGDLKYALNRALDIKSYTIKAGLTIEAQVNGLIDDIPPIPWFQPGRATNKLYAYQDPDLFENVASTNTNSDLYAKFNTRGGVPFGFDPAAPDLDAPFTLASSHWSWSPGQYTPNDDYEDITVLQRSQQLKFLLIDSDIVPLESLNDLVVQFGMKNQYLALSNEPITVGDFESVFDYTEHDGNAAHTSTSSLLSHYHIDTSDPGNPNGINELALEIAPPEFVDFDANRLTISKIYLKLIVEIEFNTINSDGKPNKTTQVLTIPVHEIDPTQSANLPYQTTNLSNNIIPIERLFSNINFNGSPVDGCELSGNNYECRALNEITIVGDLSTSSNYTAEFIAGNKVTVLPGSDISPEIVLRIDNSLNNALDLSPVSPNMITNYCQNPALYRANIPRLQQENFKDQSSLTDDSYKEAVEFDIDFSLFPNPTNSNIVTMQLLRGYEIDNLIEIKMHDLAGRLVRVQSQSIGAGIYTIDVSNIAPGTYFVTGSTSGNKVTKRLIVQ